MITRICSICQSDFTINNVDEKFYTKMAFTYGAKKIPLAPPTKCPSCREQNRLAFRNERSLYHRQCDLCHAEIISMYSPEKPYVVYCQTCWWSDRWDGKTYGQVFDWERPFFEQLDLLWKKVPQVALLNSRSQQTEYGNFCEQETRCYLVFASNRNYDCYYSAYIWDSKNCVDCLSVEKSELCYECIDCANCYQCRYAENCQDSHDVLYAYDCRSCHDLLACAGLRKKSFCILNQQYTEAAYRQIIADPKKVREILQQYPAMKQATPRLFAEIINCDDVSGSYLHSCSRAHHCFNAFDLQDGRYVENAPGASRDVVDISGCTNTELGHELVSVAYGYHVSCCMYSHTGLRDSLYCVASTTGKNIFGCIGLRNAEYCILNKQYSKEEYEELVPRIIESMRRLPALQDKQMMATPPTSSSEEGSLEWPASRSFSEGWGEFFPPSLSPFGYNETVAMEYFPLTKEEALAKGFNWSDYEPPKPDVQKVIPASKLPDNIQDIPDDILNWAIECEVTNKPFRIIKQELSFYREHNLPIPRCHPDQRHKDRMALRNPRKLCISSDT